MDLQDRTSCTAAMQLQILQQRQTFSLILDEKLRQAFDKYIGNTASK